MTLVKCMVKFMLEPTVAEKTQHKLLETFDDICPHSWSCVITLASGVLWYWRYDKATFTPDSNDNRLLFFLLLWMH